MLESRGVMLKLDRIWKTYPIGAFGSKRLVAIRDVSFHIDRGEVVSLIGESGSGKTTIGRMVLRLNAPTGGTITLDGTDITSHRGRALKDYYRRVQGVFQDPFSSFNPIFKADRVFEMVRQAYHSGTSRAAWASRVETVLNDVCLDPGTVLNKYPHQLSGGQLQRMLIARALLLDIDILVADEVISMLDASTRIDVLNLLADLKARGLGILFVTHDLALGNYISTKTIILRKGSIVEMGSTNEVFTHPQHPYTQSLLGSIPHLRHKWSEPTYQMDSIATEQAYCHYHAQMPGTCDQPSPDPDLPALAEISPDHHVACIRLGTTQQGADQLDLLPG
jgi:peptide/nickel transport system ATP-binding protein